MHASVFGGGGEQFRGERKDVSGEEEIAVVAQDLSNIPPEKT